jgi:hypothetical protein
MSDLQKSPHAMLNRIVERGSDAVASVLRAIAERLDPEEYPLGKPALDAAGHPMWRCWSCGIPRNTTRHALMVGAGTCDDPLWIGGKICRTIH